MNKTTYGIIELYTVSLIFISLFSIFADDIQQGLICDKLAHPMTAVSRPLPGQSFIDPEFGTKIVRITNSNNVIKPPYSSIPVWNADESYLLLWNRDLQGYQIYDGKTYSLIKNITNIAPADLEHVIWSATDPDVFYYPCPNGINGSTGNDLVRYHVSSGAQEVVKNFNSVIAAHSLSFGHSQYGSWDGKVFGLCGGASNEKRFAYNMETDAISPVFTSTSGTRIAPWPGPSGTLFEFEGKVWGWNMTPLRTLENMELPEGHNGMGKLANGHDMYFQVQFDAPNSSYNGSLVIWDMTATAPVVIIGPSTGYPYPGHDTHMNGTIFSHPGFVVVSTIGTGTGQAVLDNELVLADCNPNGKVARVCHVHTLADNGGVSYWGEPHPSASPSGTRIAFASDWGTKIVDTYVAELPAYSKTALHQAAERAIAQGLTLRVQKNPAGLLSVNYSLPNGGLVRLEIYNASGAKITTLLNKCQPSGMHQINWDTHSLGSGKYFCLLTQNNKKMSGEFAVIQ